MGIDSRGAILQVVLDLTGWAIFHHKMDSQNLTVALTPPGSIQNKIKSFLEFFLIFASVGLTETLSFCYEWHSDSDLWYTVTVPSDSPQTQQIILTFMLTCPFPTAGGHLDETGVRLGFGAFSAGWLPSMWQCSCLSHGACDLPHIQI